MMQSFYVYHNQRWKILGGKPGKTRAELILRRAEQSTNALDAKKKEKEEKGKQNSTIRKSIVVRCACYSRGCVFPPTT